MLEGWHAGWFLLFFLCCCLVASQFHCSLYSHFLSTPEKKKTEQKSHTKRIKWETFESGVHAHKHTHTWKQPNDASNQINVFYAFNDIKQTFFTSPTLFDQTTLITLIIQFMNGILEENLNKITNESVCFRAQMHNKTHHKDLWAMSSCESQWA